MTGTMTTVDAGRLTPGALAALAICLVAFPLVAAHGFPRTPFADADGRFAHWPWGITVSLVLVAFPTAAALVGARASGMSVRELGGTPRVLPYVIVTAGLLAIGLLAVFLRARGVWTPAVPRGYTASELTTNQRAMSIPLRLIQVAGEEFVFRGFALAGLTLLFGNKWIAAIVASACFAYAHLGSFGRPARASDILLIFVLAVILSAVALRPGGLWTAVIVHWAWLAWLAIST